MSLHFKKMFWKPSVLVCPSTGRIRPFVKLPAPNALAANGVLEQQGTELLLHVEERLGHPREPMGRNAADVRQVIRDQKTQRALQVCPPLKYALQAPCRQINQLSKECRAKVPSPAMDRQWIEWCSYEMKLLVPWHKFWLSCTGNMIFFSSVLYSLFINILCVWTRIKRRGWIIFRKFLMRKYGSRGPPHSGLLGGRAGHIK